MPVSAVLMTDKIYHAVYSSLRRAIVHTSTFSEIASRCGGRSRIGLTFRLKRGMERGTRAEE